MEWDPSKLPVRFFPFQATVNFADARTIAIDPRIAFGRPVVERTGVSTKAIVDRLDAGEGIDEVAADYGLTSDEVEQAVLSERAA